MDIYLLIFLLFISTALLILLLKIYSHLKITSTDEILIKINELIGLKFNENNNSIKDEFVRNRNEASNNSKSMREELSNSIKLFSEELSKNVINISQLQKNQLDLFADQLQKLILSNEQKFESLQSKVAAHLKEIQQSNENKLEQMRKTVDEKLHDTLEKRLGESFQLVSNQLDIVSKGLGEMRTLANGVGDLKKVLTNVKTRGTWGEVQLENLIDQILTPDQYAKNISTKVGSNDKVEFAIKLPGKENKASNIWLPIDAKFPIEDYQRLLEAQENGNVEMVNEASKALEIRIRTEAKKISEKYIDPPNTTDFAFMFLPIEGLYAEVLRIVGLTDKLQRENKIIIAGPTTIYALLNSLQMGFKTLAIEKRTSEVWKILNSVKNEFNKFGEILEKTQKKIREANDTIESATKATKKIERQLQQVESTKGIDLLFENSDNNLTE